MAFNDAARPADHRTVTTGKWRHIFMTGDALTFTLSAGAATSWAVRNYYGATVASGSGLSTSATTVTPSALPLGWYKLYLTRPSAAADPWGLAGGDLPFIVARASSVLPARPSAGASRGIDISADYPTSGFTRIGPWRHSIYLDTRWTAAVADGLTDAATEASMWGTADTVRPLRPVVCFPEGTGGASPSGTDTTRITSTVTQFLAAGVTRFEGRNEPSNGTLAATFVAEIAAFAATVRAAGGTVLGPCPIEVRGGEDNITNPGAGTGWKWMTDFFAAGGGTYVDEISFHNYNGTTGSVTSGIQGGLPYGRYTLDALAALLTTAGQQSKPRYNTEAFSYFGSHFGTYEPRLQTAWTMLEMQLLEQYGVPKERTSTFYPISHGFWAYPSWWVNDESNATLNPLAAIMRIWSDELAGKAYSSRLDFGTVDNAHFIGSRFAASDGSAVLTLSSSGRAGQVTLQVVGAVTLDVVDPWGTTATQSTNGGLVVVNVDTLPVYVRLPAGVTGVPVVAGYGVDTITPRAASVAVTATTPTTFPAQKTWTFPNATRFDRVIVTTNPPFQTVCGLLDFDVQALVSGTWTTLTTETVTTDTITWAGFKDSGGNFVDSFYPRRNQFVYRLTTAVLATAVRVNVRDVTYGGAATVEASNGAGKENIYLVSVTGSPTGGTFTLTWNGLTTSAIAWNATAATVQTALRALTGGSATTVTGGPLPGTALTVNFQGALSYRSLTGTSSLTGGTTPAVAVDNTHGATGQAGPKTLDCQVQVFLSGTTDGVLPRGP